jgi:hypothetical protein
VKAQDVRGDRAAWFVHTFVSGTVELWQSEGGYPQRS